MNIKIEVVYLKSEHTKNEEIYKFISPLKAHYPKFEEWFNGKCCRDKRMVVLARTINYNEIVGAAILKKKDNKISSFYIADDFRSEGIGTMMLQTIIKILDRNKKIRIYPLSEHYLQFRKLFQGCGLFYYSKFHQFIDALFESRIESFEDREGNVLLFKPHANMKKELLLYQYDSLTKQCYGYEIVDTRLLYERLKENAIKVNMTPMSLLKHKDYPDSYIKTSPYCAALTTTLAKLDDTLGKEVDLFAKRKDKNPDEIAEILDASRYSLMLDSSQRRHILPPEVKLKGDIKTSEIPGPNLADIGKDPWSTLALEKPPIKWDDSIKAPNPLKDVFKNCKTASIIEGDNFVDVAGEYD